MGRKKQNNVVLYIRVPIQLKDELKELVKTRINEIQKDVSKSTGNG
jgi:hypothetical protein